MAKAKEETKSNVPATNEVAGLPAYLQGAKKTVKVGNTDSSDLIIPRVKLLQAQSPEVVDGLEGARAGIFWHTIAGKPLGTEIVGVPVLIRKSYVLWAPRGDTRGILARANDGLNWDNAGMEFVVRPKKSPHDVSYKLGKTVHERTTPGQPALSEFGSSIPGDAKSPPAAALTYQMMFLFPEHMDLGAAIIINTRSSVKAAQMLQSKIDLRPVDHYAQQYKIGVVKETSDDGPFFNYSYSSFGYAPEEVYLMAKAAYERFSAQDWRASEETVDADVADHGGRSSNRSAPKPGDDNVAF